jgi:hypothetical protein
MNLDRIVAQCDALASLLAGEPRRSEKVSR